MPSISVSGRELSVTVAFRLPISTYNKIVEQAMCRRLRLSNVLREVVVNGVDQTDQEGRK